MREIKVVMHDIREEVPPKSGYYIVSLASGFNPVPRYGEIHYSKVFDAFNAYDDNGKCKFSDARKPPESDVVTYVVEWGEYPEGGAWT